ncbi:DoxX family membrane protein [Patescibacteria group bacterium]|nr:DoxX family membrane protein [Patescibacteria group bacterium]
MEITLVVAFLLGRILLGGYFLMMGITHFTKLEMMSGYAASKKVPMPKAAVTVAGVLLLIGGFGILTGLYISASLMALVLFLVPVSFMMHPYWREADPQAKMADRVNFMKNMALLGAVLILLYMVFPL